MNALIKAEFRRLAATRMWRWALVTAVLLGGGLVGLMAVVGPENFSPPMPGLDTEEGSSPSSGCSASPSSSRPPSARWR